MKGLLTWYLQGKVIVDEVLPLGNAKDDIASSLKYISKSIGVAAR
jgi:hypothetical protein